MVQSLHYDAMQPIVTHLMDAVKKIQTFANAHSSRSCALTLPVGMRSDDNTRWQKWCNKMDTQELKQLRSQIQTVVNSSAVANRHELNSSEWNDSEEQQ